MRRVYTVADWAWRLEAHARARRMREKEEDVSYQEEALQSTLDAFGTV